MYHNPLFTAPEEFTSFTEFHQVRVLKHGQQNQQKEFMPWQLKALACTIGRFQSNALQGISIHELLAILLALHHPLQCGWVTNLLSHHRLLPVLLFAELGRLSLRAQLLQGTKHRHVRIT